MIAAAIRAIWNAERHGVDAACGGERARGEQGDQMEERGDVAQHAVGEDHEPVQGPVAPGGDEPAAQEDRPRVAHHPALAGELALDRRDHLLRGPRLGHVGGPPAALDHVEREGEVVAHDRVDLDVGLAAGGVDGPVARRDRGQAGLEGPDGHLVAPVEALLVRAPLVDEADLAAGIAGAGVREGGHELAERVGLPHGVGVGEGDDLAARGADAGVLGADLPAPRELEHVVGPGGPGALGRAVGRAVAGDDDLETVGRVVEGPEVLDAAGDDVLLLVGGDDHGDRGEAGGGIATGRRGPPTGERAEGGEQQAVARLRVGEQAGGDPEEHGEDPHVRRRVWRFSAGEPGTGRSRPGRRGSAPGAGRGHA